MLAPIDRLPEMPKVPAIAVGKAVGGAAGLLPVAGAIVGKAAPGGGSGGYTFAPDEIDAIIIKWEDLLRELMEDELEVRSLVEVRPPGEEFASTDFADRAGPSGQALREQNRRMQEYVRQYIEALNRAKEATMNTDDDLQSDIARAGEQQV